jgi:hypothetical protein
MDLARALVLRQQAFKFPRVIFAQRLIREFQS